MRIRTKQSVLIPGMPLPKKMSGKKEEKLQIRICKYLSARYPHIIFMCDVAAGIKLPVKWAGLTKVMRSDRGMPDMYIFQPRIESSTSMRVGLALELKSGKESIYKKDGSLKSQKTVKKNRKGFVVETYDHLQEQSNMLERFRKNGWKAEFAQGFDEAVKIIDEYLR